MFEAGNVRYELEDKGSSESLLHCYIPKNFTARDVDLSYEVDGISKGRIAIHFDTGLRGKLGCVELDGFVFPEGIEAKYSKKQSRYTFRLIRSQKAVSSSESDRDSGTHEDQDGEAAEHFSDAASSIPRTASPADSLEVPDMEDLSAAAAAANGNGYGNHHAAMQQHQQPDSPMSDVDEESAITAAESADAEQITAGSDQSGSILAPAAAATAKDDQEADLAGDQAEDDEDEAEEETADEAVKKGKKRRGQRKKKKKKGKAGGDDISTADADVVPTAAADSADSSSSTAAAAAGADQEEQEVFLDAISEGGDDLLLPDLQQQQQQQEDDQTASPAAAAAAAAARTPRSKQPLAAPPVVFNSDNYMSHFADEAVAGSTQLPANAAEVLQLPESLLHGPFVSQCLDTHVHKGEDKGMRVVGAKWTPTGSSVGTSFSAFGIFDGHGGKPAATYASKELLPNVMKLVDRCKEGSSGPISRQPSTSDDATVTDGGGDAYGIEVTGHDKAVWAAQEALVDRLPKALFAGFLEADKVCRQRHKVSGTTATLAIAVGWELFVANVGDSGAYLDTGKEVIAVSGNHRIDDNPAERARIIAAGGEVSKSCPEGVPVGPDRVWPGGLAMSRTIGDPQAPQVIAVPDIRHVTLPTTGGRLVTASDGVWDHMQPKGMIHQVRNESTEAAAKKIAYAAIKKKGLKDDISVLVVDFTPGPGDPRPPALLPGPQRDAVEPCQVDRPLMEVEVEAAVTASGMPDEIATALQRQASVTSVAAATGGHWKEVATARRTLALALLQQQARREAEAAAAEAARLAELAAKSAAESQSAVSDTYRELAELRVDPDVILAQVQAEQQQQQEDTVAAAASQAADQTGGWETVGSGSSSAAEGGGYVPFEQQIKASAGYGSSSSRGRGRGQRQQHQHQQHDQGVNGYGRGPREYRRRDSQDQAGGTTAAAHPVAAEIGNDPTATPAAAGVDPLVDQQQQHYESSRGGFRGGRGFRGRSRGGRFSQSGFNRSHGGSSSSNDRPYNRDRTEHAEYSKDPGEPGQQQQQQQAGYSAEAAPAADGSYAQQQRQQYQGYRGRGRGDSRGGHHGRGGYRGRGRDSESTGDQQQQQRDPADTAKPSAGTNDQQPQTDQQQQQQYKPRQQRQYKPVAAASAGSSDVAAADANGPASAAPAAAVRVVPRASKPSAATPSDPAAAAAAGGDSTAAAGGRYSSSVCFKCQQPGHFARDCPNGTAAAAGDAGSAAAAADRAVAGEGATGTGAAAAATGGGGRYASGYRGRGRRGGGSYNSYYRGGGRAHYAPKQQQPQQPPPSQQEVA